MNKKITIKVCGMKFRDNREALEQLPVDFLGFIFYPGSGRFVGKIPEAGLFASGKKKVAVFVNGDIQKMVQITRNYDIQYIQLHGKESPETCRMLKQQGLKIIKAFNVHENFDFSSLKAYEDFTDFFLFDTKTDLPGGSGKQFNWDVLKNYSGRIPFFLSGGIGPGDQEKIRHLSHPMLFGIDLNSGFEDAPGIKNTGLLRAFIDQINH